jgi:D-tyrosyl-tRNA(Tyr) deacylase
MNLAHADVGGESSPCPIHALRGHAQGNQAELHRRRPPGQGEELYETYVREVRAAGVPVQTGIFGAHMSVELVNDGPVTVLLEA